MMVYDPDRHHRRTIRLRNFDYTQAGVYYVTICTHQRECLLGEIVEGQMQMNERGLIVEKCWQGIAQHFPQVTLDAFIVMPNHVHGILALTQNPLGSDGVLTDNLSRGNTGRHFASSVAGSLSSIVGSFKSAATRLVNQEQLSPGPPLWQRNYYERIVRDDRMLNNTRRYIDQNPARWPEDINHPAQISPP